MSPVMRKYKKEYAFELLRIAFADLETAKDICALKNSKGRPENTLYIAQQAMEKAMLWAKKILKS